jgi:hypothetical protein
MNNSFLFLDDIRNPPHAFGYTKELMFLERQWVIVRNYNEFKNYIEKNGLPKLISFDHDLADTFYETEESDGHKEKTGLDCAKWLIDYCLDNNLKCPEYYCHSMNPVGKENILNLLNSFNKYDK